MEVVPLDEKKRRPQPWHYGCLQLALAGAEPQQIALQLRKQVGSVKGLLASDWAQTEMAKWHQAVMQATVKDRIDPIRRFQALVDKAINKVEASMDCGDAKVELLAAQRILDNAGLSVVKRVEIAEDAMLRDLTPAELEYVATHQGKLPPRRTVMLLGNT